jgi:mono/diheme cytochrome c family protein
MAEPMAEEQRAQASLETRIAELEKRAGKARCGKCHGGTGCWALGSAIAVVLSWARNGSILWAILHGILSWIYVIYFAITRK